MRRLFFAVTGLLILLSFLPTAQAQDQPEFRFHLPCAQVVRMGRDKYFDRYTAATHDQSTAGCIEAYESYAHCRRHVSDTQARALSPTRRSQVTRIRRDLDTLAGACYDYTYLSAGGGTIWSQMEAADHAGREDFLAALIADLRRPAHPSSTATRRQANASLRAAQRSFTTLRVPQTDSAAMTEASHSSQYRSHTYPAARTAFARLQTLTASLPDVRARRLARKIQQELAAPAQNLQ